MQLRFEIAAGSIVGQEHVRLGRNNQDAFCIFLSEQMAIAVVCDGCGSAGQSEMGAQWGARSTVAAIGRQLRVQDQLDWEVLRQDLLHQLLSMAKGMGDNLSQILSQYFLFTIVGAVITPGNANLFWLGDGVVMVNGQPQSCGPFSQNAPPYLAYGLMPPEQFIDWPLTFQVQHFRQEEIESILIGSDGVIDLIQAAEKPLPGGTAVVQPISQFWQEDHYFQNPDAVRRRLSLINRSAIKPDWSKQQLIRTKGLLPDDTTLVVLRKSASVN
uniref:PPM-type phosphatase domain-containing protein n=1 Tax=Cyanothece sp. (strain PCC 7425 / ATCC 29141) TaxID=395961 RepID=B8HVC2_CYAP4